MISVMHLSGDTYASLLSVVNDIQNLKVTSSIKSEIFLFFFGSLYVLIVQNLPLLNGLSD